MIAYFELKTMHSIHLKILAFAFAGAMHAVPALSQSNPSLEYSLTTEGALSSGAYTPYMLTVNQFDRLSPRGNTGYMSASIRGDFQFTDHWSLSGGMTGLASIHSNHRAYLQELYLNATYRKIIIEVGAREKSSPVINRVLSSGDFIYSGNSKPIPSFGVSTIGFVMLPYLQDWLEAYASFGYGRLFDGDWTTDRFERFHTVQPGSFYTKDVCYHHKELYLRSNSTRKVFATIGLQHAVFFGGIKTSYESGTEVITGAKAKGSDFLKVLIPKSDGNSKSTAGDSFVYGNHLGVWYADIAYNITAHRQLRAYIEKPFEDGSGIAFRNGFDGIWGLEYSSSNREGLIPLRGLVIEYIQTTNQSGPIHWAPGDFSSSVGGQLPDEATGADNYYNNFYYNGYSNYGLSIGSALLKSSYYNEDNYLNYTDNRIQAWHLGLNGDISSHFGYIFKGSYREGYGTPFIPLLQKHHSFDAMMRVVWQKGPWECSAAYAITQGNVYGNSNGFDLKVTYHGKIL